MAEDCGILLVATGARYQVEALRCAESFKTKMPNIPITLFTRGTIARSTVIDTIEQLPDGVDSFSDKIVAMRRWPHDRMLFLDTDTVCIEPVDGLFHALTRWDVCAAHAPVRHFQYSPPDVPDYFPEFNTGVIAIRRTPCSMRFVNRWHELQLENCARIGPRAADQPAFRQALWECELPHLTLTPEYNLRTCMRYFNGGNATVKIIHDRGNSAMKALEIIDQQPTATFPRVR